MNFDIKRVKIVVTVPEDDTMKVMNSMAKAGAGIIGNYSFCSTYTKSTGTFVPNENANPYIGEKKIWNMLKKIN